MRVSCSMWSIDLQVCEPISLRPTHYITMVFSQVFCLMAMQTILKKKTVEHERLASHSISADIMYECELKAFQGAKFHSYRAYPALQQWTGGTLAPTDWD